MSPYTSLQPWTGRVALGGARAPPSPPRSPLRGLSGCPRRVGVSERIWALPLCGRHWQRTKGERRGTHRVVATGQVPHARRKRLAAQVPRLRGREFESRSRKRQRLPAAPAHCQPLGPGTWPAASTAPGDPSPRTASQRPAGSRGRTPAATGGREEGGRGGPGIFTVGGDSGRGWNPAIGGYARGRGNFAALRAGSGGKGCGGGWASEQLMINARRLGQARGPSVSAPPCQPRSPRAAALRGSPAPPLYKEARGGVTLVSQT